MRIDPTAVNVGPSAFTLACAEEGSPRSVIGDSGYPFVGYDDGEVSGTYKGFGTRHLNCRTYMKIDYDFSALMAEAEITGASLSVTQKAGWSKRKSQFGLYLVFFVKHFSLKKAYKFPFFVQGISLLSAGR